MITQVTNIEILEEIASDMDIETAAVEVDYEAIGGKTAPEF
ncbi:MULTISPECIES: hypothetical protein [Photorhabdus]|uniref:Uncharacterized protein n=1 Tax=Photorhabdus bodei TaxID=2029681 RepID=A0AAW6BGJ0_9GAMM|nr:MULTISPECIES: hypothetical protein [Photorhabdus]MDB6371896.1 hypothetical protein [Photorhabdus bodei]